MRTPLTKPQIWGPPIALGLATAVGLVAALLSDGIGDAVSWVALATPVAVCVRGIWAPRRSAGQHHP
jgi:hypothetical protein